MNIYELNTLRWITFAGKVAAGTFIGSGMNYGGVSAWEERIFAFIGQRNNRNVGSAGRCSRDSFVDTIQETNFSTLEISAIAVPLSLNSSLSRDSPLEGELTRCSVNGCAR